MRGWSRRGVGFVVMVGLVASLVFGSAVSAEQADAGRNWGAILSGGNEIKVGEWAQWGTVILSVGQDGQSINYTVNMGMITNPQKASIYLGSTGTPVATLWNSSSRDRDTGSFSGVMSSGTITAKDLTGSMQGKTMNDLLAAMKSGNTYVNVLTVQAPEGAARGAIVSMENNHL